MAQKHPWPESKYRLLVKVDTYGDQVLDCELEPGTPCVSDDLIASPDMLLGTLISFVLWWIYVGAIFNHGYVDDYAEIAAKSTFARNAEIVGYVVVAFAPLFGYIWFLFWNRQRELRDLKPISATVKHLHTKLIDHMRSFETVQDFTDREDTLEITRELDRFRLAYPRIYFNYKPMAIAAGHYRWLLKTQSLIEEAQWKKNN